MTWREAYELIEFIVEKNNLEQADIDKDLKQLNILLNGFEAWDEAYRRFNEFNEGE